MMMTRSQVWSFTLLYHRSCNCCCDDDVLYSVMMTRSQVWSFTLLYHRSCNCCCDDDALYPVMMTRSHSGTLHAALPQVLQLLL